MKQYLTVTGSKSLHAIVAFYNINHGITLDLNLNNSPPQAAAMHTSPEKQLQNSVMMFGNQNHFHKS